MEDYLVSGIAADVRVAMDQNRNSAPMIALQDADTLTLEEMIVSRIPIAARMVELSAPLSLLGAGKPFATSIGWEGVVGIGSGRISLPDDFLRLVTFKMSDWSYAVNTAVEETDPLYRMQGSAFGGVRGNPQRPVVALLHDGNGLMLQFWSCKAGQNVSVTRARYIPIPEVVNGHISVSGKLRDAVVYKTAYLTALGVRDSELAASMKAICDEMLQTP